MLSAVLLNTIRRASCSTVSYKQEEDIDDAAWYIYSNYRWCIMGEFRDVDYRVRQYTVSCTLNVVFTFCCSMLTIIFFFAFFYL